jgi:hypothetical protein
VGRGEWKKGRKREEEEGMRGEKEEEKRTAEFHSSQIIPPHLFPRKKFLFSTPGLFIFSKCALSPPPVCRSRLSGRPRRRCAALNGP